MTSSRVRPTRRGSNSTGGRWLVDVHADPASGIERATTWIAGHLIGRELLRLGRGDRGEHRQHGRGGTLSTFGRLHRLSARHPSASDAEGAWARWPIKAAADRETHHAIDIDAEAKTRPRWRAVYPPGAAGALAHEVREPRAARAGRVRSADGRDTGAQTVRWRRCRKSDRSLPPVMGHEPMATPLVPLAPNHSVLPGFAPGQSAARQGHSLGPQWRGVASEWRACTFPFMRTCVCARLAVQNYKPAALSPLPPRRRDRASRWFWTGVGFEIIGGRFHSPYIKCHFLCHFSHVGLNKPS